MEVGRVERKEEGIEGERERKKESCHTYFQSQ